MKATTFKTLATVLTLLWATLQTTSAQSKQAEKSTKPDYKTCYTNAKATIDSMLAGQIQPSFEKALFVTENAYWGNALRYGAFDSTIDKNIQLISAMVTTMKKHDTTKTLKIYPHEKKEEKWAGHANLQNNWGIFTYLTDTTRFVYDSVTYLHLPLQYSTKDPYGTLNWANTMVTGIMVTNHGNCYAMACMYKLLADKLKTGANIATAPGHAFIQHTDDMGITYNMELASHAFEGDGTIEAYTYTTNKAIESGIAMRSLTDMQDISMCLVYLAKGYENRTRNDNETEANSFVLNCAQTALQYDSLNLNAMLLEAEVLESKVLEEHKTIAQLQTNPSFITYQKLIRHIYNLGYREMPIEMQNTILAKLNHDNYSSLTDNAPKSFTNPKLNNQNIASNSNGTFDEEIKDKPTERFHKTLFNTKTHRITGFDEQTPTYINYSTDPVVAAMSVDPLTAKYPMLTPYQFADNKPILAVDLDGLESAAVNGFVDPTESGGDATNNSKILNSTSNTPPTGSTTTSNVNTQTTDGDASTTVAAATATTAAAEKQISAASKQFAEEITSDLESQFSKVTPEVIQGTGTESGLLGLVGFMFISGDNNTQQERENFALKHVLEAVKQGDSKGAQDIINTWNADDRNKNDQIVLRYVSLNEFKGIFQGATGQFYLPPSPGQEFLKYVTPDVYTSGADAKSKLALKDAPQIAVLTFESEILATKIPAGPGVYNPVEPANNEPGGGREAKIFQYFPIKAFYPLTK